MGSLNRKVQIPQDFQTKRRVGPNGTHCFYWRFGIGTLFLPENDNLPINSGRNFFVSGAVMYRLRLANNLAAGVESTINLNHYSINTENPEDLPDVLLHDFPKFFKDTKAVRQWFSLPTAGFMSVIRINLDRRRGDKIGTFIDIAGGYEYLISSRLRTTFIDALEDKEDNFVSISRSNLSYVNNWVPSGYIRLGRQWFSLRLGYRFDEFLIGEDTDNASLPRYFGCLEISY